MNYPKLIESLIEKLMKLPGIGRRSAERIVFWFLSHTTEEVNALARDLIALKEGLQFCRQCNHLTDIQPCPICQDSGRDRSAICVVEDPKDVIAIG